MNYLQRRDIRILIGVIVIGLGIYGFTIYDTNRLQSELETFVEQERSAYFKDLNPEEFDVITRVESGKTLAFTGKVWGVIRIYTRKKDDTTMESFEGIEFFYVHENGAWVRQDSAAMREPTYIYEAYRDYVRDGYEVDDEAFVRY